MRFKTDTELFRLMYAFGPGTGTYNACVRELEDRRVLRP
jgi:hypothetical protein